MNIRTHGITALLDIYRKCVGNQSGRFLISASNEINWRTVKIFFNEIAKLEYTFLLNEYFVRDSFDKRTYPETKIEEKQEVLKNVPILYRAEEKYICLQEPYWENRYYKALFYVDRVDISPICNNYLEGLEWVYRYYTNDCPDWRWKYNYHYPPLFSDLAKYVPDREYMFIHGNNNNAFSSATQLSYVLPINVHYLMPEKIACVLREKYVNSYPEKYDFQWAFCRYFWEAHPLLPDISMEQLECIEAISV
jgi:5'-3' exonuclease